MEEQEWSPEESFALINSVIQEAKSRFVENGHIYMFWGILIFLVTMAQFILLQLEMYEVNYYPYFLIPFGGIYSWYYNSKQQPTPQSSNSVSNMLKYLWLIIGLNAMVLGFVFSTILLANLIPVILLITSIGVCLSGIILKEKWLLYVGIFSNLLGFVSFAVDYMYQPLVLGFVALIANFIPGWFLQLKYKRRNEV